MVGRTAHIREVRDHPFIVSCRKHSLQQNYSANSVPLANHHDREDGIAQAASLPVLVGWAPALPMACKCLADDNRVNAEGVSRIIHIRRVCIWAGLRADCYSKA